MEKVEAFEKPVLYWPWGVNVWWILLLSNGQRRNKALPA